MCPKNKYFIIEREKDLNILKYSIEKNINEARTSNDGKFLVVKLPLNSEIPDDMKYLNAYNHEEILKVLEGQNWISNEEI